MIKTTPSDIPRETQCRLCRDVWEGLDGIMEIDVAPEFGEHVLGSVIAWWVANSLRLCEGAPERMFTALTNALAENGVHVTAVNVTTPPSSQVN